MLTTLVWSAAAPAVCRADDSKAAAWAGPLLGVGVWQYSAMELGVMGGYTFAGGAFLGGEISTNALGYKKGFLGKTVTAARMHRYLVQFGYDFALDEDWRLRPELSTGVASVRNRSGGHLGDGSYHTRTELAVGLGLAGLKRLGTFFVGLEGHLLFGPVVTHGDEGRNSGIDLRAFGGVAF